MVKCFNDIYRGKTVFITGHTGFKGSWLCLWLKNLGAKVVGYSFKPPSNPNHFELLNPDVTLTVGDIRSLKDLRESIRSSNPDIVVHMAAQSLVRYSFKHPVETFETNVLGTVNILEACTNIESLKAIIIVSSDKCYENKEWVWKYRENDPMGGFDPYSASKGCAELVTASYRNSFFNPHEYGKTHNTLITSVRAGNVIGGGDWAEDRLIPDIMKASNSGRKVIIRNPHATRPWQHVLEPLSGYLMLGQKLLEGKLQFAQGWNFGPDTTCDTSVYYVVAQLKKNWDKIEFEIQTTPNNNPHEANLLHLDCSKVNFFLKWKPVWGLAKTLQITSNWYKEFYENNRILSQDDLNQYVNEALENALEWASYTVST